MTTPFPRPAEDPEGEGGRASGAHENMPSRRVAASASDEDRKRAAVRAIVVRQLRAVEEAPTARMPVERPERVILPRVLVRRPFFTASKTPPPYSEPEALQGAKPGESTWRGSVRLAYHDLRLVALICWRFRREGAERHRGAMRLPTTELARQIYGRSAGSDHYAGVERGLARLCRAEFAFHLDDGTAVGSPQNPVTILSRDPTAGKPDTYQVSGWLLEILKTGIDQPRTGLIEFNLRWDLMTKFQSRPLLLWAWLECEDWGRRPPHAAPNTQSEGPAEHRHFRYRIEHLLAQLDLHRFRPPGKARERLVMATKSVGYRHSAYEVFQVTREHLLVWRLADGHPATYVWTGEVCARCRRPTVDRVCCHARFAPGTCGDPLCWACNVEGH
jgi:hypothetical protein